MDWKKLRKPDIIFEEDGHTYFHGRDNFDSVSSISSLLDKPYLKQWVAKLTSEYILNNYIDGMSREEMEVVCLQGKKQHIEALSSAGAHGTNVHTLLEEHVNACLNYDEYDIGDTDEITKKWYSDFKAWEAHESVEWYFSELVVCDMVNRFAGRLDAIAKVNGKLTLIDFKTSSQISTEHYLQTAGYVQALRSMGLDEPIERLIIRIPKTKERFVYNRRTRQYALEINELEFHYINSGIEDDISAFLHLLAVNDWKKRH